MAKFSQAWSSALGKGYTPTMLRLAAALWLASSIAFAAPPGARPPAPVTTAPPADRADIEFAEELYSDLDYEQANEVALRAVKRRGLSHDALVRSYRVLALTHATLGHDDAAREAFIRLLAMDPDYKLDPNLSPRVQGPFFEARGFWRAQPARPGIEVKADVQAQGGALRLSTRDPTKLVRRIETGYRWGGGAFNSTTLVPSPVLTVNVPRPETPAPRLEYYAQALDENDSVVYEAGSRDVPRFVLVDEKVAPSAPVRDEAGGSIFASPWFWTITGAVLVGGGVTAFALTRPAEPPTSAQWRPILSCGPETACR